MNSFESNIINLYGNSGKIWLKDLPNFLQEITTNWELSDLNLFHNVTYTAVFSGLQRGRPVVLKLRPDVMELKQEATALKAFESLGAVRVLNQKEGALLLERVIPGLSLKSYFPAQDAEAIQIVCDILKRIHLAPASKDQFPSLETWLGNLDKTWPIPPSFLEKGRFLRDKLLATSSHHVLLHGDLHPENILQNGTHWSIIDPKGVLGDPLYDAAPFIRNPLPELLTLGDASPFILRRISEFSKRGDFDPQRLKEWCFVQSLLAWTWALEDRIEANSFKRLAEIFENLLMSTSV